jgi:molybdate transport system substrate-binding protein
MDANADEVTVAVAANFAGPLAKIGEGFTAATGHTLRVSSGATGKFYSQIISGAPFEVLIAADTETPRKLMAEGHGVTGSSFTYAIGKLALWSAQPGYVDDQGAVLTIGNYAHLAIANPKLAPYGRAGLEVLKARGLGETVAPKLVTAESIAQAYQFAATGNAELGFVALWLFAAAKLCSRVFFTRGLSNHTLKQTWIFPDLIDFWNQLRLGFFLFQCFEPRPDFFQIIFK